MTLLAICLAVVFLFVAALRQRWRAERQRGAAKEGAEIWARAVESVEAGEDKARVLRRER